MKQLITSIISLGFFASYAYAADAEPVSIRCSTNNSGGSYSVFVGTMTEQVLSGELSRGVGAANMESVRTIFTVSAPGVPSSINGVLSFLLKADLRMPVPFDQVGWENPNFTVSKSLLVNRRGGMVENGTAYQGSQKVPYQFVYKCVSF